MHSSKPHFIPDIKFNGQQDMGEPKSVLWPETSAFPLIFSYSAHCSVPCPQEEDVGSIRTDSRDPFLRLALGASSLSGHKNCSKEQEADKQS